MAKDTLSFITFRMKQSRDSVTDIHGPRTPFHGENNWPERVDEAVSDEPQRWVKSCCVLCTNGCGMEIGVKDNRIVGVRGIATDRVNRGRLGPKGLNAWVANHSADRLTKPLIRDGKKPNGPLREASWDEAMSLIVRRCTKIREQYTSGAIGFYTTGQLFLEDYFTISTIAQAGLGTIHIDGNTRLCTATAAMALRETFGQDGNPASITDYDECDCLLHCGHNVASTQTVSWMRILDRRRGPNPPTLIVIDPRRTATAAEADIHIAPRIGTNLALMNGLIYLVIESGAIDHNFIEKHTVGFEQLKQTTSKYPPQRVEEITGVPIDVLRRTADAIAKSQRLLCTVLQGFYQSHQATAASVQVNNLVLIRGMIGKPGCGVIQSNGQPTAQNTRETGCDGEMPGFRNWENDAHVQQIADIWNVDKDTIPHWGPHTHAMQLFRLAELGSIKFLWIVGTNPAVSLPELKRIRRILRQERVFVIVNDAFPTETTALADVVLPAAMWGEKTGTFTNFDRTVHISHKAIDSPGEARSDMDIFLDFAQRMQFRDKDGQPLIKWRTPEECFEAWKRMSKGTPCDYSGLSYAKLTESPTGIQWPCNEQFPDGKTRLYEDFIFPTRWHECIGFGHDLEIGAHRNKTEYKANDPGGRAILKDANYFPPFETPDSHYPFTVSTGRVVYHFHTRTKTGRSKPLNDAAPEPFVEINRDDAARLNIGDGDLVELATRRATITVKAKIAEIIAGHLFVPFHYGYWDEDACEHQILNASHAHANGEHDHMPDGSTSVPSQHKLARSLDGTADWRIDVLHAANEFTYTAWDPVSKQPCFKYAAAQLAKAGQRTTGARLSDSAGKATHVARQIKDKISASMHSERSHLGDYLGLLKCAEEEFAEACRYMTNQHDANAEIREGSQRIRDYSQAAVNRLVPFLDRYGEKTAGEPHKIRQTLFPHDRTSDGFGLLRDIQALYVMLGECDIANKIVMDASKELRDDGLLSYCRWLDETITRQQAWCITMTHETAAQSIVVPA